jgi:hypothetical protein
MNQVILMMLLDSSMILLLGATIYFCITLNTRIKVLQDSKAEFSQLIERFDVTTTRAQQSIQELQTVSKRVQEQLSERLDKANFLADDLAFMIEKGGKIADRMDGKTPNLSASSAQSRETEKRAASPFQKASSQNQPVTESPNDRKRAALESMLQKVSPAAAESEPATANRRRPLMGASARLRSKAEQELYDALKTGNKE